MSFAAWSSLSSGVSFYFRVSRARRSLFLSWIWHWSLRRPLLSTPRASEERFIARYDSVCVEICTVEYVLFSSVCSWLKFKLEFYLFRSSGTINDCLEAVSRVRVTFRTVRRNCLPMGFDRKIAWVIGYGWGVGFVAKFSRQPTWWTPKTYGLLQSMGYHSGVLWRSGLPRVNLPYPTLSGWSVLVGEIPLMKKSIIAGKPALFWENPPERNVHTYAR